MQKKSSFRDTVLYLILLAIMLGSSILLFRVSKPAEADFADVYTAFRAGHVVEFAVDGNKLTADTAVTYNMTVTPEWVRRVGDVNYDDATNAADLIILEQFMLGIGAEGEIPDVNGDGIVDTVDAVIVQMAVLGIK